MEMGIGINTGEVVVGNIGSEKRTKYGIVGSPVNLTYRIESYTNGGQILIAEETLKAAGDSVKISSKKQVQPKGIKHPITIYEVYGVGGFHNLYLPKEEEVFVAVPKSIPLQYAVLEGKQVSKTVVKGKLVKLSGRGAEILAESQEHIPAAFTNLKLNFLVRNNPAGISEDIYAKVSERSSKASCFSIQFTSLPVTIQTQLDALYWMITEQSNNE